MDPADRLANRAGGIRRARCDFAPPARAPDAHQINGGAFWDDLTANLPDFSANGIAADRTSRSDLCRHRNEGVYYTYSGSEQPDRCAIRKTQLTGLPARCRRRT